MATRTYFSCDWCGDSWEATDGGARLYQAPLDAGDICMACQQAYENALDGAAVAVREQRRALRQEEVARA